MVTYDEYICNDSPVIQSITARGVNKQIIIIIIIIIIMITRTTWVTHSYRAL